MPSEPEVRFTGELAQVRQGRRSLYDAPLQSVIDDILRAGDRPSSFEIRPAGVRIWEERRDAVAAAFEVTPHARTLRWLADDSGVPFGPKAKYAQYFVSFPYIVLLLVFRRGALTGQQQLYYRTESLDTGEDLQLPNLYNVAEGYGQRCWVCLQTLGNVARLPWPQKVDRIIDHVFSASFNRSSEEHEGNSYWSSRDAVDPRVASMEAWQKATRESRRFALEVKWKPAGTTASAELRGMLDRVVAPQRLRNVTQLAGLIAGTPRGDRRR